MEIMGIRLDTIVKDNVARRCEGCLEEIEGTPWRVNILDIVSTEVAAPWNEPSMINPGPFEFHPDEAHVRSWMAERGYLFCRKGRVREIMRPIPILILTAHDLTAADRQRLHGRVLGIAAKGVTGPNGLSDWLTRVLAPPAGAPAR